VPVFPGLALDVLTEEGLLYSKVFYETRASGGPGWPRESVREDHRTCFITPAGFRAVDSDFAPIKDVTVHRPPVEITESLSRFQSDFPDSTRLAFIMMQFGTSSAHLKILSGIRSALDPHGMLALRADDKQYHDYLYFHILTYISG